MLTLAARDRPDRWSTCVHNIMCVLKNMQGKERDGIPTVIPRRVNSYSAEVVLRLTVLDLGSAEVDSPRPRPSVLRKCVFSVPCCEQRSVGKSKRQSL